MKKFKLKNGIRVIFEKNFSRSVAVEIMFKVGSNYESSRFYGISHYLEHMLFEGTKKRRDSREIANEIEKYGAEFNAYTTGDRTAYFIKIINSKFVKALDILSDMVMNPIFDKKIMEKEKQVILKEINMVTDDPRQHQWILFQRTLFDGHPAGNPTYGSVKTVKGITRRMLVDYYKKHYTAKNMIISIAGNVDGVKKKIEKHFSGVKSGKIEVRRTVKEPLQNSSKKFIEERNIENSYMVLGYKTVARLDKDSYALDVVKGILGRGQSGWMFDEIRNKRGLAYQVGILHEHEKDYGYFAVFTGLDRKNIPKAKNIILQQFKRLQSLGQRDMNEAKSYIEGNLALDAEDNFHLADKNAYWETIKDARLANDYLKKIKKVRLDDAKRAARKYLNENFTLISIQQK